MLGHFELRWKIISLQRKDGESLAFSTTQIVKDQSISSFQIDINSSGHVGN